MDLKEAIKKANDYKNLLKEHLHFNDLYIYGSYAKNNFNEDSDIDVAVIIDRTNEDFFTINPRLWTLRRELVDRIEPILVETDFDESGFYLEITKNGIKID